MNLFGIDSAPQRTPLFKLGGVNQQPVDTTENGEVADTHSSDRKSINIMAGHFVHAHREESRYVAGIKAGLALQNSFRDQMQAVVSQYRKLVELSGDPSYAKDAVKAVNSMVDDEEEDANSEKLEEIREDIEEKAEEAVAPESQKALENETSPQEALDESLDEVEPEAQAKAEGEQAATDPDPNAAPVAAAPGTDQPQAAAPGTAQPQDVAQETDHPRVAAKETAQSQAAAQEAYSVQGAYGKTPVATSISLMV